MNFNFKSDDLAEICCILGFFKGCKGHGIRITTPLDIQDYITSEFTISNKEEVNEIVLPSNDFDYHQVEIFAAKKRYRETLDLVGTIISEPPPIPLRLPEMVSTFMYKEFGLVAPGKVYFPTIKPSKNTIFKYPNVQILIDKEEYRPLAEGYQEHRKLKNSILCIENFSLKEKLELLYLPTLICIMIPSLSELAWPLNSLYNGFDRLKENYPVYMVMDNLVPERRVIFWAGCIPIQAKFTIPDGISMSRYWKIRQLANFNHLELLKKMSKGIIKQEEV